jgi:pimeloyl-ACP methyl ester carboxylesterase
MSDVRTIGSGPSKVMCLPGWFGSSMGWGHWPELLDQDSFTYGFTDYRGYGRRMDESGDYTLDEIAGDTIRFADDLGWDKFAVIGHSMGGTAMQRVLLTAPDRVTKLVGISPVPSTGVPFDEQGHDLFYGAADNPGNRRAIIDFTTGNRLSGVWLDQMVEHSMKNSTRDSFAGHLVAWAETDFSSDVQGNETPVLALPGEHDPALGLPVQQATFQQQYPNCTIHVSSNAGHYAMFETPVALATTVETFLRD